MKQTTTQLRAALKNRTLDEFWGAKDLPKRLILSYTRQELEKVVSTLKILLVTSLLVLGCLGPWTAFARQPEPVSCSEQEIVQLLVIEAYVCPEDFAPFDRSGADCPNLAVTVYYNGHFLFEATTNPDLGPKAEWDTADLPHDIYISYFPDDVFTVYLVHVPDLEGEQRDTIEIWEVNMLDKFSLFPRHLFTENGSYVVFTIQEAKDKPKLAEEPEEESEGYFEATEAGIIIKSW